MKSKPKGAKYRNLTARSGVIYYERKVDCRRIRFSTATADWNEAASVRDLYERRKGIGTPKQILDVPRFRDAAERYLREGMAHLSASTREDRESLLGTNGILTKHFGGLRLDDIGRGSLLVWWQGEVEAKGRAHRTGLNYLSAISGVLGHAVDLEVIFDNPVDGFRATLRRKRRTQRGRATDDLAANIRPIESAAHLRAFVEASAGAGTRRFRNGRHAVQSRDGHIADLLQLDAGLRFGEVAGLRWRHVRWGDGLGDTTRSLLIQESRSRGRHDGPTKSGRARRVALSLRLRKLLREYWIVKGQPDASERILPALQPQNYRARHFAKVCEAAGLEDHTPKDLRDTFASQLLTAGVQLGYVSKQLGHSDVSVTARHYAKWIDDDAYRHPLTVGDGEVPADLIERIGETVPIPTDGTGRAVGNGL
ncbi:MAG: site-specific integrase [Myxococcales bacterium]|nr:site-specific integrase [Myxococcales bacterium]